MNEYKTLEDIYPILRTFQSYQEDTWITTFTNLKVDLNDFKPQNVSLEDIAHAHSMTCRWGGHASRFYSVAEHVVLVSRLVREITGDLDFIRAALLHDSSEAYMVDLPSPLKKLCPGYKIIEKAIGKQIAIAFGVKTSFYDELIHKADRELLLRERFVLMPRASDATADNFLSIPNLEVVGLPQEEAKKLFLDHAREIGLELHV